MYYTLTMFKITWKLGGYLETHHLRPRDVETEAIRSGFQFGRNTIYRLLRNDGPKSYDKDTLTALIVSLRNLTGQPVTPNDLLEVVEERSPASGTINPALRAVLGNTKPLNLEELDTLTDPTAEDPTAWFEASRKLSWKALKRQGQELEQGSS
jgi:hypothetical protein